MALINMSRPKPEVKEERVTLAPEGDSYYEKYPYGLRISLRNEQLEKLGIDVTKYKAGDTGILNAKVIFTEVCSRDMLGDSNESKKDNSMEIQITDLEVTNSEDFEKSFKEATEE